MSNFLASLAGNIGASQAQRVIDEGLYHEPSRQSFFDKICQLCDDIRTIARHYKRLDEPSIDEVIALQQEKRTILKSHGRWHNAIYSSSTSLQIRIKPPKSPPALVPSGIGWIALDMPDGTEIWLDSGSDTTVLYRCSNRPLGGNTL